MSGLKIKDLIGDYQSMEIRQNKKDGSADILFSWKEIWILIKYRKLHLTATGLKHFGNAFIKIVADWQTNFGEKTKKELTYIDKKYK